MTTQERDLVAQLQRRADMIADAHARKSSKKVERPFTLEDFAIAEISRLRSALAAQEEVHTSAPQTETPSPKIGDLYAIEHDGFVGTVIGFYQRSDGYKGVVMQQAGTKIVHVYGLKWLSQIDQRETE